MLYMESSTPESGSEQPPSVDGAASNAADDRTLTDHRAKSRAPGAIIIVERNLFFRDCLQHSIVNAGFHSVHGCASLADLLGRDVDAGSTVVLLSIVSLSGDEIEAEFATLASFQRSLRSIVLAKADHPDDALKALGEGANGFISMNAPFDIFIEAIRFVGAGGIYVPPQCLLAAQQSPAPGNGGVVQSGLTNRELSVVHAIREGKPNKVIAYELNMCESTVKVHVRHIMKKLHARNRTDVAVKGAQLAGEMPRGEKADSKAVFSVPALPARSTTR